MAKKYKIIIIVCSVMIICNLFAKISILDEQAYTISILQKVLSAARNENFVNMGKTSNPAEEVKFDVEKIIQQIPQELSFTELASKLRLLIDKNQLSVKDTLVFRPGKTEMPALVEYHTQFSVNGDYGKIKGFISDLQNVPGLLYLDSVKIVRIAANEPLLKLSLGISIFFRKSAV